MGSRFSSGEDRCRTGDSAAHALLETAIVVVRIDAAGSDRAELAEAMGQLAQLQAQRFPSPPSIPAPPVAGAAISAAGGVP